MKTYYANAVSNGIKYLATVTDFENGFCGEQVIKYMPDGGTVISEADFKTSNLKGASKDVYAQRILASAIYKEKKAKIEGSV